MADEIIAIHECGHALIGTLDPAMHVFLVTLVDPDSGGYCAIDKRRRVSVEFHLAGLVAEHLILDSWIWEHGGLDLKQAAKQPPDEIEPAIQHAGETLIAYRAAHAALVRELVKKRTLTTLQIARVIEAHPPQVPNREWSREHWAPLALALKK